MLNALYSGNRNPIREHFTPPKTQYMKGLVVCNIGPFQIEIVLRYFIKSHNEAKQGEDGINNQVMDCREDIHLGRTYGWQIQ